MLDIHEALRRKQAKYIQLGKQIELLQHVVEKLREVAPLLAEESDEENSVALPAAEEKPVAQAAAAQPGMAAAAPSPVRTTVPRWP